MAKTIHGMGKNQGIWYNPKRDHSNPSLTRRGKIEDPRNYYGTEETKKICIGKFDPYHKALLSAFKTSKESPSKDLLNGDERKKTERNSQENDSQPRGYSKTKFWSRFANSELKDVSEDPKDWITKLELPIDNLHKLVFFIVDTDMMTHVPSHLPGACEKSINNLEDDLDGEDNPLNLESASGTDCTAK